MRRAGSASWLEVGCLRGVGLQDAQAEIRGIAVRDEVRHAKDGDGFPQSAEKIEHSFDEGEDITAYMDVSTLRRPNQERYARLFPKSEEELDTMLAESAATPRSERMTMEEGMALVKERMGWDKG